MTDPVDIANALKATIAGLPAVKNVTLGQNTLPETPAAEVWLLRGRMEQASAAQQPLYRERHEFIAAFYVPVTGNLEDDEIAIGSLLAAFVQTIHDPAFDFTLGGLVEHTRAEDYEFDVMNRNGHDFRVGVTTVIAETY